MKKNHEITLTTSELNKVLAGLHSRMVEYTRMMDSGECTEERYQEMKSIRASYNELYWKLREI